MLDQEAVNVARRMIKAQIGERQEDLRLEANRVHSEMTKRGIGRSTIAVREVHNLCAHEIENWAWIVWRVLHRSICTVGVQPSNTLAKDLKDEVLEHVQPVVTGLTKFLDKDAELAGFPAPPLTGAGNRALDKINAEIDLFVLSLSRHAETTKGKEGQSESLAPVFNIYSPIGAIQTGPSATANVVQNLDSQDREVLLRALDLVKQNLASIQGLAGCPKEEILDLVEESKTELQKAKPNTIKLQSILTGVGTTIQNISSLHSVYQTLKAALLPLGIMLP